MIDVISHRYNVSNDVGGPRSGQTEYIFLGKCLFPITTTSIHPEADIMMRFFN
jgi:hypothetical protein